MALLPGVSFRSRLLEHKFKEYCPKHIGALPQRLASLVAAWCVLRLLHFLLAAGLQAVAASLGPAFLVGALACRALVRGGAELMPAATFCASWLLPLCEGEFSGGSALPGRAAALLALLEGPSLKAEGRLLHGVALAATLAGAATAAEFVLSSSAQGSGSALALCALACVAVGACACQIQDGLERRCRELFLLQYRAAAKAKHFRLLLGCLLPVQIVEPYFERCVRLEGCGGLLASPVAQRVSRAGVLFMAIDSFDKLATSRQPLGLIQFLNDLFTALDTTCKEDDRLVKIETVGEVYVVASGLFGSFGGHGDGMGDPNIPALAEFALQGHCIAANLDVKLCAGLHCGPLVAGIIGDKLPRFRLFGDTVNAAARLEQHCPPGKVLASKEAADFARWDCGFQVQEHGWLPMKGLGTVYTFQITAAATTPKGGAALVLFTAVDADLRSPSTTSDTSPNLKRFLNNLPELEDYAEAPVLGGVAEPSAHPLASPLWGHLERGLAEPAGEEDFQVMKAATARRQGEEKTKVSTPQMRASRALSAPGPAGLQGGGNLLAPPELNRLETPTAWLSPGKQLPPRSRSVFSLRRSPATFPGASRPPSARQPSGRPPWPPLPLSPALEDGSCSEDEHPEDELKRLCSQADASFGAASCPWQWLAFTGCGRFKMSDDEIRFRDTQMRGLRPLLLRGCLLGALGGLCCGAGAALAASASGAVSGAAGGAAEEVSRPLAAAAAAAAALLACAWGAGAGRSRAVQSMSLHAAPVVATLGALWQPTLGEPLAWALLVGAVCAELPQSAVLALAVLTSILHPGDEGQPWSPAAVVAGRGLAAVAVALTSGVQDRLARRCFASDSICTDVLGRLRTVAEDLLPPSVVAEVRHRRFGAGGGSAFGLLGSPSRGAGFVVHRFDTVSVLQTDLVGFTALARELQPEEVLRMLNDLFGVFDRMVNVHDVFKMETVGDAYICASGLPDFADGEHRPQALLQLALDLHAVVARYRRRSGFALGLRAGLHSGPAIGGVVGTTMQRYHLFGGTMHVTEKLEATAPTGTVHLSEAARKALAATGTGRPAGLVLEGVSDSALVTSKGERVRRSEVGGLPTFIVRPHPPDA